MTIALYCERPHGASKSLTSTPQPFGWVVGISQTSPPPDAFRCSGQRAARPPKHGAGRGTGKPQKNAQNAQTLTAICGIDEVSGFGSRSAICASRSGLRNAVRIPARFVRPGRSCGIPRRGPVREFTPSGAEGSPPWRAERTEQRHGASIHFGGACNREAGGLNPDPVRTLLSLSGVEGRPPRATQRERVEGAHLSSRRFSPRITGHMSPVTGRRSRAAGRCVSPLQFALTRKCVCNSFGMCTCRTLDLKSSGINSYKKHRGEGPLRSLQTQDLSRILHHEGRIIHKS